MDNISIAKEIRTAIKQGDIDKVVSLIGSDKARLNMMTPFGTWLHVAASIGNIEIVKLLVDLGADVNCQAGTFDAGPLTYAASAGHLEIVSHLLSCNAKLDVSEPERNPLFAAIQKGHTSIAMLLIEGGIDTTVKYSGKSMKNMDALAFAHEWGREDIAGILTALGTKKGNKKKR